MIGLAKLNVLIPSAGARVSFILYFKEHPEVKNVITTEINPLAPGVYVADKCYKAPRTLSSDYIPFLLSVCEKERVNLIIPLMDLDIVVISRNREVFLERGIKLLLHPKETVEIAADKYQSLVILKEVGVDVPNTLLLKDADSAEEIIAYPMLLKPRYISMKNSPEYFIKKISDRRELEFWKRELTGKEDRYILQEYLAGTELTVDFFCYNGEVISIVPGERLAAVAPAFSETGGAIIRGKTFHSEEINELVFKVAEKLKFHGPANFQGYKLKDGSIKITEINPRLTGASVMTKAAGADFFKWSIDMILGKELKPRIGDFKEIYMTCWNKPIFFEKPYFL